jgi:hypothetical protein
MNLKIFQIKPRIVRMIMKAKMNLNFPLASHLYVNSFTYKSFLCITIKQYHPGINDKLVKKLCQLYIARAFFLFNIDSVPWNDFSQLFIMSVRARYLFKFFFRGKQKSIRRF